MIVHLECKVYVVFLWLLIGQCPFSNLHLHRDLKPPFVLSSWMYCSRYAGNKLQHVLYIFPECCLFECDWWQCAVTLVNDAGLNANNVTYYCCKTLLMYFMAITKLQPCWDCSNGLWDFQIKKIGIQVCWDKFLHFISKYFVFEHLLDFFIRSNCDSYQHMEMKAPMFLRLCWDECWLFQKHPSSFTSPNTMRDFKKDSKDGLNYEEEFKWLPYIYMFGSLLISNNSG